ncbi:unnamed protein product [Symbiodinium sp. CCMP2592]|nr:unnamed protein product [Symbiodinium sp. CCMP2592]
MAVVGKERLDSLQCGETGQGLDDRITGGGYLDEVQVVAVMDHGQQSEAFDLGAVSVAFAGPRRTADDLICLLARRLSPKRLVVVASSDRELRQRSESSPETPKQQLRRIRRERSGGSRGFATWVSSLARGEFQELLRGTPVPPLPEGLASLHAEEQSQRLDSLKRSYVEPRERRRQAARRLQEWFATRARFKREQGDARQEASTEELQMKQLCAVLTGMQVSHNYEQGQQLLQNRDFSTKSAFFQTVLEIGRRYKILNPERMRDSYGKLMYFLQDSRKPEVRDLLEFDVVSPVRSVWHVLSRSPKGTQLLQDPWIGLQRCGSISTEASNAPGKDIVSILN